VFILVRLKSTKLGPKNRLNIVYYFAGNIAKTP
jgi:hypothetical protein